MSDKPHGKQKKRRNKGNKQGPPQNNQPRKFREPRHRAGEVVYLHAYADAENQSSYFLCKGVITRPPKEDSPVYKIVVTAVDPKSLLCGENPQQAKRLLGKRIVRKEHQITAEISDMMSKMYEGHGWLELSEQQVRQITGKIQKEKENDKRDRTGNQTSNSGRKEEPNLATPQSAA